MIYNIGAKTFTSTKLWKYLCHWLGYGKTSQYPVGPSTISGMVYRDTLALPRDYWAILVKVLGQNRPKWWPTMLFYYNDVAGALSDKRSSISHTHTHTHTHTQANTQTQAHNHLHNHIHTHTHTHAHTHTHTSTHTRAHTHTCTHIHIHTHTHTRES